ncbi:MAG: fructose-6-phosphate aldolase [Calditrichaeota bacterium]|nr:MAG: fructose-6-phosphate aldolase [Calditrichota bacterium]
MKFFLDTANIEEIRQAASMGILDGVTTNPTLISKEEGKFKDILLSICEIVDGPVNAEVVATDYKGMIEEAHDLANLHPNIVVKIPMIREGLKAVKTLSGEGIRTNVTLCFSPSQALMAAKAGATFVSPFIGRVDDISGAGMNIIADIRTIYDNYGFETEILAASLRHPMHVVEAALIGADVATMPFKVFDQLINHPLTDIGLKRFLEDWEKVKERIS